MRIRRRQTLSAKVLQLQPRCIYCGGMRRSDSADHAPPKAMFDRKDRPRGLEFGACHRCHDGTRGIDAVASMWGRVFPPTNDPVLKAEFAAMAKSVKLRYPKLRAEIGGGTPYSMNGTEIGYAMRVNGPIMTRVMNAFAGRMGLALHFHHTGEIVPPEGELAVRWMSNVDAFEGKLPEDFLSILGPPNTLTMGRNEVSDQFQYAYAAADDRSVFGYFATFRMSFAIMALIRPVDEDNDAKYENKLKPGFLAGFVVE